MTLSAFIISPPAKDFAERARQRANTSWSFLTWAFFISQILGNDQLVSSAAAASTDEPGDLRTPDISDSTMQLAGPTHLPGVAGVQAEETAYQAASKNEGVGHTNFANAPLASHYAAIEKSVDSSRLVELNRTGTLGSAGDRPDDAANDLSDLGTTNTILDMPLLQNEIDYLDAIISDVLLETLHPVKETIDDLIGSASESLDGILGLLPHGIETLALSVNAVDTLATDTVPALLLTADHVIRSVEEPFTTVVTPVVASILGDVLDNHMHHGQPDVGSSGHIEFATIPASTSLNDLFSQEKYTDYHLALRASLHEDTSTDQVVSGVSSTGLFDHILVRGADHNEPQHENTSLPFGTPSIIEEIAQRGLGDGISH